MEERGEGSRRGGTTEGRARAHGSSSSPPACRVGSSRTPLGHPAPPGGRCAVRHIRNPPPPTGHLPPSHPRSAAGHLDAPDEDLEQVLPHLPPRESARPGEGPERRRGRHGAVVDTLPPRAAARDLPSADRDQAEAPGTVPTLVSHARARIYTQIQKQTPSVTRGGRESHPRADPIPLGPELDQVRACVRACVRVREERERAWLDSIERRYVPLTSTAAKAAIGSVCRRAVMLML